MRCIGIYREMEREMEMEMEMEMVMERILGILGGAELVKEYEKIEKMHKHTPWFRTLVGKYSKILEGFWSVMHAAAGRFLTHCSAMVIKDRDGYREKKRDFKEIEEQQKNILRMDVGGQLHTISKKRANRLGGLLGDEDVLQMWQIDNRDKPLFFDRDFTHYPGILRPEIPNLGQLGTQDRAAKRAKRAQEREINFLSMEERPRHQQPPPTAKIIQYLLVTAFQKMRPYTQALDAHNIIRWNPRLPHPLNAAWDYKGPYALAADEVSDAYERKWRDAGMLDEAEQDRLITEQNQDIIRVANGIFQALTRNKDQKINRDASIIIEAHLKPGDNHEAQIAASLASLTEKFKSDLSLSSTYCILPPISWPPYYEGKTVMVTMLFINSQASDSQEFIDGYMLYTYTRHYDWLLRNNRTLEWKEP